MNNKNANTSFNEVAEKAIYSTKNKRKIDDKKET